MKKAKDAFAETCKSLIESKDYNAILKLLLQEPNSVEVLYHAGLAYQAMGSSENAVKCWKKALTVNPKKRDPRVLRALAHQYLQDVKTFDQAADMYEMLDEDDESESNDMAMLGEIYMRQDKFEDAHHCFVVAIDQDPDNTQAYIRHSVLHARWALRQMNEAKKRGNISLDELPNDEPELRFLLLTLAKYNQPAQPTEG